MIAISFLLGRKALPNSSQEFMEFIQKAIPRFTVIGALIFFAVAASEVLTELGLSDNIAQFIDALNSPAWLTLLLLGIGITIIAGPLTSTGTLTAVGLVSYEILIASGFSPLIAAVAVITFASTSAQMPPASGSIYIASGIVGAKPRKNIWYVNSLLCRSCCNNRMVNRNGNFTNLGRVKIAKISRKSFYSKSNTIHFDCINYGFNTIVWINNW